MTNMFTIVGRLVNEPMIIREEETNEDYTIINVAVGRNYKNEFGEYDTDFIRVKLCGSIATNIIEYCRKGDLIGVKGKIESINYLELIAEKITFLSSNRVLDNE